MGSTALSVLEQRFGEAIEDWVEVAVTTDINNDNIIVSTNLNAYDGGQDDYFNDWWVYITTFANAGVERQVSDYVTSGGTLTIRGAALADDTTDAATVRVQRYRESLQLRALNRAMEIIYPALHQPLDDMTLVTGNILPDASFEWWTASTSLNFCSTTTSALTQTTTAGLIRGQRGTTSAKLIPSAASGYFSYNSDDYPQLLDLMNKTVHIYVWAYPEVADDATMEIYTKNATASTQTLASTTACPAGEYTLISLKDQVLNDNLTDVQIRFRVASSTKYTYFDDAKVFGRNNAEYVLPTNFQDGDVNRVYMQRTGYSDVAADDILARYWDEIDFSVSDDGTYKYLQIARYADGKRIRLEGYKPFATLSSQTDTIATSDNREIKTIIARAALELFEMMNATVSSEDTGRFKDQIAYWSFMYNSLISSSRRATLNRRLRST